MKYSEEHLKLYKQYISLQSEGIKDTIDHFKPFGENKIKVVFNNGSWIRVYKNSNNQLEWY